MIGMVILRRGKSSGICFAKLGEWEGEEFDDSDQGLVVTRQIGQLRHDNGTRRRRSFYSPQSSPVTQIE